MPGMRFVTIYLIGYFLLLGGAAVVLWQSGMLQRMSGPWLALAALVAVGLGLLLAAVSGPARVGSR